MRVKRISFISSKANLISARALHLNDVRLDISVKTLVKMKGVKSSVFDGKSANLWILPCTARFCQKKNLVKMKGVKSFLFSLCMPLSFDGKLIGKAWSLRTQNPIHAQVVNLIIFDQPFSEPKYQDFSHCTLHQ